MNISHPLLSTQLLDYAILRLKAFYGVDFDLAMKDPQLEAAWDAYLLDADDGYDAAEAGDSLHPDLSLVFHLLREQHLYSNYGHIETLGLLHLLREQWKDLGVAHDPFSGDLNYSLLAYLLGLTTLDPIRCELRIGFPNAKPPRRPTLNPIEVCIGHEHRQAVLDSLEQVSREYGGRRARVERGPDMPRADYLQTEDDSTEMVQLSLSSGASNLLFQVCSMSLLSCAYGGQGANTRDRSPPVTDTQDSDTFDLLCEGRTNGIPGIESPEAKAWLKVLKPRTLGELAVLVQHSRVPFSPNIPAGFSEDPSSSVLPFCNEALKGLLSLHRGHLITNTNYRRFMWLSSHFDQPTAKAYRETITTPYEHVDQEEHHQLRATYLEGVQQTLGVSREIAHAFANYGFGQLRLPLHPKAPLLLHTHWLYLAAYRKAHEPREGPPSSVIN
jgi:hypothetical protein